MTLWDHIRMFVCERLLCLIIMLAPAHTPDGYRLLQVVRGYVDEVLGENDALL